MKKYLFVLVTIILCSQSLSQDWKEVLSQSYEALYGSYFIDDTNGWMVGLRGEYLKTSNGGVNWERPVNPMPVDVTLNCVQFLDMTNGFIGADDAQVLTTTDGGLNWNVITLPTTTGDVEAIYFSDVSTGWVLASTSSQAHLLSTTDGGSTWSIDLTHSTGDLEAMNFYAPNKGICVGGGSGKLDIYYTTDGTTWNAAVKPTLPPVYTTRTDLKCVVMTSETTAHVSGWGSRAVGLQPSIHLKTTDGGATWTYMEQQEENRTYVNMNTMWMKDAQTGFAAGGSSYRGSVVVKTIDGGVNWVPILVPFGFSVSTIYGTGDKIWIGGGSGGIAYSQDLGNSWQLISDIPSSTLYNLTFVDDNTVYAAGFRGLVLKSTDRGNTWKGSYAASNMVCPTIQDIHFTDINTGFAARGNRMVTKTTDGGQSWVTILNDSAGNSLNNYGVHFIDANYGFVVGRLGTGNAAIYKTTDGGVSWSEQFGGFASHLNDVFVIDQNNIAIIGEDLTASYSTDGGTTWNNSTVNGLSGSQLTSDLNSFSFLNSTTGIACGGVLLKTSDGGKTWDYVEIPGLDKELKSCTMASETHWFTVGDDYIFETTDAGVTWTDIADPSVITASQVFSIDADKDGYPWVGGTASLIYTNSPLVNVIEINNDLPKGYKLSQNYPNPFNPSTVIEFSILHEGHVNISIYDLLGKKVAELVNEHKIAGSYKVQFDAGDLLNNGKQISSGIYFYTLNANGNLITNKMMLIK